MRRLFLLALLAGVAAHAEDWGPLQFLVGHWTGEGSGSPGVGSGAFSFTPDLQGHVLVRRSFAEYPAKDGRPATRHDDLMIVYREAESPRLHAVFFDSEGHVIRYGVTPVEHGAQFVSDGGAFQMRFRLTYIADGANRVKLRFEIAPPGRDFATYLDAAARREQP